MRGDKLLYICPFLPLLVDLFLQFLELPSQNLKLFFISDLTSVEFLRDHGFCVLNCFLLGMLQVNLLLLLNDL